MEFPETFFVTSIDCVTSIYNVINNKQRLSLILMHANECNAARYILRADSRDVSCLCGQSVALRGDWSALM